MSVSFFFHAALALLTLALGAGRTARASTEIRSPYTPVVEKWVQGWHSPPKPQGAHPILRLQCFSTPDNGDYVGLGQQLTIAAPLTEVAKVLDDFEHYSELFPDLESVHVLSREGSRLETDWVEHVPLFFVPNVRYRMAYWIDTSQAGRRVYKYQLIESNRITRSDGAIILEALPGGQTAYSELDFLEADWGMLKTFAPGRIWKDTVEGISLSDVAIQEKAEHPTWDYGRIRNAAKASLDSRTVSDCVRNRQSYAAGEFMR